MSAMEMFLTVTAFCTQSKSQGLSRSFLLHGPCKKKIVDEPPAARPESPHQPQVANHQEDAPS